MSGDNRLFTLMEAGRLHEGGSEVAYETEAASGRHPHWIKENATVPFAIMLTMAKQYNEKGFYDVIQVLSVLTFLGSVIDRVIGIGTLWIENGELPLDDTLALCSFILGFSGLAKLIKYLGRGSRIYLWISLVLSLIATGLIIAAAFLKLNHENRVTTLKLPITFGLCAYLLTELYSISKNVKFICDASQILKTLHHAHPERQGNV